MRSVNRIVKTDFWEDKKTVEEMSAEDRYFFLYLLTNPHTTQLGIYHLTVTRASNELGYSKDCVRVLLDRFQNKYKLIKYSEDTGEIAIKNYLKHSIIKGGKPVYDCLIKELSLVEDKSLIEYLYINLKCNTDNLNNTVIDLLDYINTKGYINNINIYINDNDNERYVNVSSNGSNSQANHDCTEIDTKNNSKRKATNEDSFVEKVKAVIDYLNEKANTKYRYSTQQTRQLINARLKEKYTVDDFKAVIDCKVKDWGNDKKMSEYLRPQTLFGTKFESYLQQALKSNGQQDNEYGIQLGE